MKTILLTITVALFSTNTLANGFSPWAERTVVDDRVEPAAQVEVGPYYKDGLPAQTGQIDEAQFAVTIKPYYLSNS